MLQRKDRSNLQIIHWLLHPPVSWVLSMLMFLLCAIQKKKNKKDTGCMFKASLLNRVSVRANATKNFMLSCTKLGLASLLLGGRRAEDRDAPALLPNSIDRIGPTTPQQRGGSHLFYHFLWLHHSRKSAGAAAEYRSSHYRYSETRARELAPKLPRSCTFLFNIILPLHEE